MSACNIKLNRKNPSQKLSNPSKFFLNHPTKQIQNIGLKWIFSHILKAELVYLVGRLDTILANFSNSLSSCICVVVCVIYTFHWRTNFIFILWGTVFLDGTIIIKVQLIGLFLKVRIQWFLSVSYFWGIFSFSGKISWPRFWCY